MRGILLTVFFGAACCGAALAENAGDVAALRGKLEHALQETQSLQAEFVQTRKFRALNAELKIGGQLSVASDGRMAWEVRRPMRYLCILTPDGIKQWDEESNTVLTLSHRDLPWLKALHEGLRSWFRADFRILERDFTLSCGDERTLRLIPKPGTIYYDALCEVDLVFAADFRHVARIVTTEKSGDVTELEFTRVDTNTTIPETTWRIPPVLKKP